MGFIIKGTIPRLYHHFPYDFEVGPNKHNVLFRNADGTATVPWRNVELAGFFLNVLGELEYLFEGSLGVGV